MKHDQAQALAPVSKIGVRSWPLSRFQDQLDQLFEESFDRWLEPAGISLGGWSPTIDLFEDQDNVVVKTELPGMKKEEIDVYLTGDSLNIAGERKEEAQTKTDKTHRAARYPGRFHRRVPLPCTVDSGKIQAVYKDGVLTINCPKTEEAKKREIKLKITWRPPL